MKGRDDGVKVLGEGKLTKKLTVKVHKFSAAREGRDRQGGRHRRGAAR